MESGVAMELSKILDRLGYVDSPHFLRRGTAELRTAPEFGHVFRKAIEKPCQLEGVYTLRRDPKEQQAPLVPVMYVCRANSEQAARTVHKLVWNQDVAPFVLVYSPENVRFYSGFRCQPKRTESLQQGVLRVLSSFNEVAELAESIGADAINSGKIWREWGSQVTPETRVDWKLLDSLKKLDLWLRKHGGLSKDVSHGLIGKYVYLHYLKDRNILSPDRLAEWNLDPTTIFGRNATQAGLKAVTKHLDGWLNGSVFPLDLRGKNAPDDRLISRVAATFSGDTPVGEDGWQLHFDFQIYDFSYIPIETLSVIYEQFLHAPEEDGSATKGEKAAAYYTPIPVVNFMLSEMDAKLPLKRGMKVFDPACGSGAFLVQAYRKLIEKEFIAGRRKTTPHQLRELLTEHIYGIDVDQDACSVTELSLILTLLDYCDPPDLLPKHSGHEPDFKLPTLRDENIFETNFFAPKPVAKKLLRSTKFDWVVGNPPWKDLDPSKLAKHDEPVWEWMCEPENKKNHPCGDNEVAQAFVWRSGSMLSKNGASAMLLPAMTLFESHSKGFREQFISKFMLSAVANFSNWAEVLFGGRSRVPVAAFFYGNHNDSSQDPHCPICLYSPFVANQESSRQPPGGRRVSTWNITVSLSEMQEIRLADAITGSSSCWKVASWGSVRDTRLLSRLCGLHPSISDLEIGNSLFVSEGPALVQNHIEKNGNEQTVLIHEVMKKPVLKMKALARLRHLFVFPDSAFEDNTNHYGHLRRGVGGIRICRPPHVIVGESRRFAVYSDDYLIVPTRQIGIVSLHSDSDFLKSLSIFLSSDFALYHQFFTSSHFGVKRDVATLSALRKMPVPIAGYSSKQLKPWVELHSQLVKTSPVDVRAARKESQMGQRSLFATEQADRESLLKKLNEMVYEALGLDDRERALVHDLVHVKLELNDGKVGQPAVRAPKVDELRAYARRLKKDLDAFIEGELDKRHQVGIIYDKATASGMVQVDLIRDFNAARKQLVESADSPIARQMEKARQRLRKKNPQWVYFDRNLRIYEGTKTFILKPLQRFHWTESQAMQDAAEIISETLQLGGDDQ